MSIASRARTRPRCEAVVNHLRAHADFADLIAEDRLEILYNPSAGGKDSLDEKLMRRLAKLSGILITVTPVRGKNLSTDATKVRNDLSLAVNVWTRPSRPDESVSDPIDPLDLLDEVERVLQGYAPPYASGDARPQNEALRVGDWVEVPDPIYLNHEIQVAVLLPIL